MTPEQYEHQRMRAYDSQIWAQVRTGESWRDALKRGGIVDLPGSSRRKKGHFEND